MTARRSGFSNPDYPLALTAKIVDAFLPVMKCNPISVGNRVNIREVVRAFAKSTTSWVVVNLCREALVIAFTHLPF